MKTNPLIYFLVTIQMIFYGNRIEAGDLYVVTTLPSLASITQSIGGEFIDVYSITRGVQDAHYVEAKPSYMMKLNKADLLVYSGLELEIGWLPLLIQGARNDEVTVGSRGNLNASSALPAEAILERPRGEVDRSMGDVHPLGNPHYLLNPNNAIDVTYLITDKLCELDPEHKSQYRKNSEQFIRQLKKKIDDLQEKADHLRGKELVCYHVHWSYFLGWLGIESAGYIESRPGIPPTPRHKQEIIQMMTEHNIKVVIISTWKEPTRAEEVAESTGATLLLLPGEVGAMEGADDYVSWVEYLTTQLVDAFPAEIQTQQQRKQKRKQERKRGTK
jgi:ABC-type Zn uptake system ZnuABC Zn-binding protein ZnuA